MSELATEKGSGSELGVTLLVDRSAESEVARALLEESGVPFIVVPSDPEISEIDLPAVYVPKGSLLNGSRSTFTGLREIRTIFLPRFRAETANRASRL